MRTGAVLGCFAAVVLVGCAFEDVTIHLPRPAKVSTGSHRGAGRPVLLAGAMKNARPQDRCGMRKNGYNGDMAKVLCDIEPEKAIGRLLSKELAAAGFVVLRDPDQAGPDTITLSAVVEEAFLEPKLSFFFITFETDVALRMTARTASGLQAERRFYVKGEEATYFATAQDMERSFESASRQLVASVVGAVANLADQFPSEPIAPQVPKPPADEPAPPAPAPPAAPPPDTAPTEGGP